LDEVESESEPEEKNSEEEEEVEDEDEEEGESESEEDSESDEAEQDETVPRSQENDLIKSAFKEYNGSSNDQGFTRPKVLILAPFKSIAKEIVEMIMLMTHEGKLKKVSRRKKFKKDFGNEEDAFNDHFKIGISFAFNKKT
jgi:hypothetical protein